MIQDFYFINTVIMAQGHCLHVVPIQITRRNISLTWPRFIVYIYVSQGIEEIRHFRKCLEFPQLPRHFWNCLGICRTLVNIHYLVFNFKCSNSGKQHSIQNSICFGIQISCVVFCSKKYSPVIGGIKVGTDRLA